MGFNGDLQFLTSTSSVPLIMRVAAASNPNSEVTSTRLGNGNHLGVIHFDRDPHGSTVNPMPESAGTIARAG